MVPRLLTYTRCKLDSCPIKIPPIARCGYEMGLNNLEVISSIASDSSGALPNRGSWQWINSPFQGQSRLLYYPWFLFLNSIEPSKIGAMLGISCPKNVEQFTIVSLIEVIRFDRRPILSPLICLSPQIE